MAKRYEFVNIMTTKNFLKVGDETRGKLEGVDQSIENQENDVLSLQFKQKELQKTVLDVEADIKTIKKQLHTITNVLSKKADDCDSILCITSQEQDLSSIDISLSDIHEKNSRKENSSEGKCFFHFRIS